MINTQWNKRNTLKVSWTKSKSWLEWICGWAAWWKKNKYVKGFWWNWLTTLKKWIKAWSLKVRQWIRFTSNSSS